MIPLGSINTNDYSIAILMCTFNGEKYIRQQIESIISQTHTNWTLYISDDGSTDSTIKLIDLFEELVPGRIIRIKGPGNGFARNFMSLANDKTIDHDFYAFSDQDDYWLPNKLEVAIAKIRSDGIEGLPNLYCGKTKYVDQELKIIGHSKEISFPPSFRNAFVESIAGGNTMVFDRNVKRLLEEANQNDVVSHDWWLYLLVSGAGGKVIYDQNAYIYYRQHGNNMIGEPDTFFAKYERLAHALNGRFGKWVDINLQALHNCRFLLLHTSIDLLSEFGRMREASFKDRFRLLLTTGIYRQSALGTFTLSVGILLNKV